jgi:hypothetical protein
VLCVVQNETILNLSKFKKIVHLLVSEKYSFQTNFNILDIAFMLVICLKRRLIKQSLVYHTKPTFFFFHNQHGLIKIYSKFRTHKLLYLSSSFNMVARNRFSVACTSEY